MSYKHYREEKMSSVSHYQRGLELVKQRKIGEAVRELLIPQHGSEMRRGSGWKSLFESIQKAVLVQT